MKTQKFTFSAIATAVAAAFLSACGGGSSNNALPPQAIRFIAPEDSSFVGAINPANPSVLIAPPLGSYAGKRLFHTATVDPNAQTYSSYAGSTMVYKAASGGLFKIDLVSTGTPSPVPLSSESRATIDDTCSYTSGPGLAGTASASDFANPANSTYFYRLPSAAGVCGAADDTVRMVKLGMSATDAPVPALMPIATARSNTGAITGFVAVQGATLTLFDSNFANPRVLFTAAAPITQAYRLSAPIAVASTNGIFVVNGSLVFVDYAAGTASAPLFTLSRPAERPVAASSGDTLYFADTVVTGSGSTASTTATLYRMPLTGSTVPSPLLTEPTRISALQLPTVISPLVYSVVAPGLAGGSSYTIKTVPASGGAATTVLSSSGNEGSFTATGANIYYTSAQRTVTAPRTVVFSNTTSGAVRNDGTVLLPPLANSRFATAAERSDTLAVTRLFRVRGLAPVTTTVVINGETVTDDGAAGGTLESLDVATNLVGPVLGIVPSRSIAFVDAALIGDVGFLVGSTRNSSANPNTRELLSVNAGQANSLVRLTSNLP